MKRLFRFAVCVALCAALMTANLCGWSAASGFYGKAEMLLIKSHAEADAGLSKYVTVQGACTDGRYAYFACMQGGAATLMKYDVTTWEYIDKATIGNIGHGNDMTYNPDKKWLVVANNAPYYDVVTLIDPQTLSVIKDVQLDVEIYSIAYNAKKKAYVVGISGGYDFALLDADFKVKKKFEGVKTGYTRQGCDCDDNYIYFMQSGGNNLLVVYNYKGDHLADIPLTDSKEAENIFHVGGNFYTTLFYYGNSLYRIGFSDATQISYTVSYDPNGGEGEMAPTKVHYGKETKLRKASFTRDGYIFAGWRVQRSSDGKYVGYRNGSDDFEWLRKKEIFNYYLYPDAKTIATTVKFGNVKLYAVWVAEQYDIDFNSGEGEGDPLSYTVEHREEFTVPDVGYTREGYVFDGYTAIRDHDERAYGYRADSKKPEWLYQEDVELPYVFRPGDSVSKLTAEGSVMMTAHYRFAYAFSKDGSTLEEYSGVDEKVHIPMNGGRLTTLAQGAFKDNEIMKTLIIPPSVTSVEEKAVSGCPNLREVYFEGALPEDFDNGSIASDETLLLYEICDGQPFFIGFLSGRQTLPLIRCHAASLEDNLHRHYFMR